MRADKSSFCRICSSLCPIVVTVDEGVAIKVAGDREAPLYEGVIPPICIQGIWKTMGLIDGDIVEISKAVVGADAALRRGFVSMTHCYGGNPDFEGEVCETGSNVNALTDSSAEFDPITGLPRMGSAPNRIDPCRASSGRRG